VRRRLPTLRPPHGEARWAAAGTAMRGPAGLGPRSSVMSFICLHMGVALTRGARGKILDFRGLGGPGRPENPSKRWAKPPTFLRGFPPGAAQIPKIQGFPSQSGPPCYCHPHAKAYEGLRPGEQELGPRSSVIFWRSRRAQSPGGAPGTIF